MEGFTLSLALVDAIPVLSFGISMVIIAGRFHSTVYDRCGAQCACRLL